MPALTRADIDALNDLPRKEIQVPEWGEGVTVWIRMLTSGERDEYEEMGMSEDNGKLKPNLKKIRARLAAFALCDADGNQLYSRDEIDKLAARNHHAIKRIADAAHEMNRLGFEAVRRAAKN